MIYVCSDIHGFYSEYLGAVSLLGNDDKLYIIGDILDRGSAGIKIIRDIIKRDNVTLVKGNHELMMLEIFENILFSFGNTNEIQNIINEELVISQIGQEQTLIDFSKLERREQ
ncbi:MAG: fructose-bisphosphatase class III, partial [Oscillospiraceae bacterium]|nr:fructose-bisphosphatase class III [Oscillospiraceae bacterium]